MLTEAHGVPLGVVVAEANRHDMKLVKQTVKSVVVPRPRPTKKRPQGMCLDKGYDYEEVRATLREFGFTVQFHAQRTRLPHIMFEVRQDEISDRDNAVRYAQILHGSLREPLSDPALYTLYQGDNLDRHGGLLSWRHAMGGSPLG